MNFKEWWTKHLGIGPIYHTPIEAARSAWEASKAEERERCAKIAELHTGIKDSQVQSTARVIAEQIHKGE